jgi:YD repeat-containing protein
MRQSAPREASSHSLRRAGTRCRLAGLIAVAAGAGCGSGPSEDLPLQPCGAEEKIEARFGNPELLSSFRYAYDEQGNRIRSELDQGRDGTIDERFDWEYSPAGSVTRVQLSRFGTIREVAAQYADDGRLLSVAWTAPDLPEGRVDYEYDGEQRIIERWDYSDDGTVTGTITYTYGADGKLEEYVIDCPFSMSTGTLTLQYGAGGRIERIAFEVDGAELVVTQYSYDRDGLLVGWERLRGDTVEATGTYELDSNGHVTRSTVATLVNSASQWTSTTRVYDRDGRPLSTQFFIDDTLYSTTTYHYECPESEDSPGRLVAEAVNPLPAAPLGPRAGMGTGAISTYVLTGLVCP